MGESDKCLDKNNAKSDILELIKDKKAIRKYKEKAVPQVLIHKIIEAGIWSPAVHGVKPSNFVVVTNKVIIREMTEICLNRSRSLSGGGNLMMTSSINVIKNAPVVIVIYTSGEFVSFAKRLSAEYVPLAKKAELEASSAAIQNMELTAKSLHLGSCWLNMPLFCEGEINELLKMTSELVAVLTVGYPLEEGVRSKRKNVVETVKYFES